MPYKPLGKRKDEQTPMVGWNPETAEGKTMIDIADEDDSPGYDAGDELVHATPAGALSEAYGVTLRAAPVKDIPT